MFGKLLPVPPFGFSPGSSFTCFLFLYRHFALLSYPGTPHNFLGFLSLVLLVLRTNVICISSLILFQKVSNSHKPFFFLRLHSPAKPPLTNLDLPNLNSLTSTPAGNEVKHHQPDLLFSGQQVVLCTSLSNTPVRTPNYAALRVH